MKPKNVNISKKYPLYLYTFLVLYNPGFFNNDYLNYMLPFAYWIVGFVLLNPQTGRENSYQGINNSIKSIVSFGIIATILFCFRAIIAGVSIFDITNLRIIQSVSVIVSVLSIIYVGQYLKRHNLSEEEQIAFLLNVCMIQFVIILLCIIFPDFRMALLKRFYLTDNRDYHWTISKRVYGMMSNYTFSGSAFHGIMAFFSLYLGMNYNKKYYLYIPALLIMIFLNARIGLIVFAMAVFIYILLEFVKGKNKSIFSAIIFISLLVVGAIVVLPIVWPSTYSFFLNGFEEIISFSKTGVGSTERISDIDRLTGQFRDDFNIMSLIFGNGHRIRTGGDIPAGISFMRSYTDIGLLNDMYMGGILYMYLLYFPFLMIINTVQNRSIRIVMFLIIVVCNLKGEVFRSPIIIGTIVFACFALVKQKESTQQSIERTI